MGGRYSNYSTFLTTPGNLRVELKFGATLLTTFIVKE